MEFKVGDKIVCVNPNTTELKLNNTYTIREVFTSKKDSQSLFYFFTIIEISNYLFEGTNFISLLEFRKMKILNIKTRINVKEKTIIT